MALPSSTNASHAQTMPTKSLRLSSDSDGHTLMVPSSTDSRSMNNSSQEQATSFIVVMKGLRQNQTLPPRYADGLLNDTHLMLKHPPFLVDAHKWCDNKVETCDVHVALKPLHGSQQRTQIVASVSKVAWMRVTRMPSHQTCNHAWRVAHQISLHSQQTDRCKCGMRITVDHVHFECRFVKPLWVIFAQANGLSVNSFVPQTQ